jgi:hypothetical protein
VVLAPVLCGWLIEGFRDYRLVFLWCAACAGMSFIMCVLLFRQWLKLGGETGYTPPGQAV